MTSERHDACAAAGIDVDPDVTAADLPGLADDLRHLVPDLVRWHLLDADLRPTDAPLVLDRFVTADGQPRTLVVTTPPGSDRLLLAVEPSAAPPGRHLARCYWDARHTDRLREHLGGDVRTPFFHRDGRPLSGAELPGPRPPQGDRAALTEWECRLPSAAWRTAWLAAGVEPGPDVEDILATGHHDVARWSYLVPAARDLLRAETGRPDGTVHFDRDVEWWPYEFVRLALTLRPGGEPPLLHVAEPVPWSSRAGDRPVLPPTAGRDPWFLAPLRTGELAPAGLHPLVRAALFPDLAG